MASTYPLEVVEAARFVKANPNLKDAALDEALKKQTWDDSVKSLVAFPQVLTMMNDKLDWTQKLGDAFLAQQKDVMDAVQRLRAKAQAEGNLKSSAEQTVSVEPAAPAASPSGQATAPAPATTTQTVITIEPANPQVVYVPTYNPTVVYGAWPYPAYPPYYYYPPGYAAATFAMAAISFGVGMAVGSALWGGCNWGRGDVNINVNRYNNFTNNVNVENRRNQIQANRTNVQGGQQGWQHNPQHRQGVQYRDSATQQRFNKADLPNAGSREAFRGRAAEGRQELSHGGADQFRGAAGRPGAGGATGGGVATGAARTREGASGFGGGQGAAGMSAHGGQARSSGAFDGMGQGRDVQAYSQRGQSSLGAARASGGGGGRAAGASGGFHGGGGARGGGGRRR
jgi:hypothetical protein